MQGGVSGGLEERSRQPPPNLPLDKGEESLADPVHIAHNLQLQLGNYVFRVLNTIRNAYTSKNISSYCQTTVRR